MYDKSEFSATTLRAEQVCHIAAKLGVQDFYQPLRKTQTEDCQADPNRLVVRQISKCQKDKFSNGIFPNISSLTDASSRALNTFSKDVRCLRKFKKCEGDIDKIVSLLTVAVDETV